MNIEDGLALHAKPVKHKDVVVERFLLIENDLSKSTGENELLGLVPEKSKSIKIIRNIRGRRC